mgnify:CR=1 FL=1
MHWLDLFNDTDEEIPLDDAVELEVEFLRDSLPATLLAMRKRAGLTQAQVAARMGRQVPHVSKLERYSARLPQLPTVIRYLHAVGARLVVGARHGEGVHDASYRTGAELRAAAEVRAVQRTFAGAWQCVPAGVGGAEPGVGVANELVRQSPSEPLFEAA